MSYVPPVSTCTALYSTHMYMCAHVQYIFGNPMCPASIYRKRAVWTCSSFQGAAAARLPLSPWTSLILQSGVCIALAALVAPDRSPLSERDSTQAASLRSCRHAFALRPQQSMPPRLFTVFTAKYASSALHGVHSKVCLLGSSRVRTQVLNRASCLCRANVLS